MNKSKNTKRNNNNRKTTSTNNKTKIQSNTRNKRHKTKSKKNNQKRTHINDPQNTQKTKRTLGTPVKPNEKERELIMKIILENKDLLDKLRKHNPKHKPQTRQKP